MPKLVKLATLPAPSTSTTPAPTKPASVKPSSSKVRPTQFLDLTQGLGPQHKKGYYTTAVHRGGKVRGYEHTKIAPFRQRAPARPAPNTAVPTSAPPGGGTAQPVPQPPIRRGPATGQRLERLRPENTRMLRLRQQIARRQRRGFPSRAKVPPASWEWGAHKDPNFRVRRPVWWKKGGNNPQPAENVRAAFPTKAERDTETGGYSDEGSTRRLKFYQGLGPKAYKFSYDPQDSNENQLKRAALRQQYGTAWKSEYDAKVEDVAKRNALRKRMKRAPHRRSPLRARFDRRCRRA